MDLYRFANYRQQMKREMNSADDLWARANALRKQGRMAEADRLEDRAERIDNRHATTNYWAFLNEQ